jgi:flap endonuclease-1
MKFIEKFAPAAVKKMSTENLNGRIVAIDASMAIYQFLIAVRHMGSQLTDLEGKTTSHLQGILGRTVHLIQSGIRPIYVFDGKPPEMKSGELQKRAERREEAERQMQAAIEAGNEEIVEKFQRRTVRLDPEQAEECQKLLGLMGVPFIVAPCEAEAECAALCRAGKAYATATEDMDALAHATPILLRHLTGNDEVVAINYETILEEAGLSREQFVDFCILCGCDYCDTIKGIGPQKAYQLIQKHGNIESVVQNLDLKKYPVPDDWDFQSARKLFFEHEVDTNVTFQWKKPDKEGMIQFLATEKGFSPTRIENYCKHLASARGEKLQTRMDSFFSQAKAPATAVPKKGKAPSKKPPVKGKKK